MARSELLCLLPPHLSLQRARGVALLLDLGHARSQPRAQLLAPLLLLLQRRLHPVLLALR